MRLRNLKNKDDLIRDCMYLIINLESYKGICNKLSINNNTIQLEIILGNETYIK